MNTTTLTDVVNLQIQEIGQYPPDRIALAVLAGVVIQVLGIAAIQVAGSAVGCAARVLTLALAVVIALYLLDHGLAGSIAQLEAAARAVFPHELPR
jgi:hypothetical protein